METCAVWTVLQANGPSKAEGEAFSVSVMRLGKLEGEVRCQYRTEEGSGTSTKLVRNKYKLFFGGAASNLYAKHLEV